MAILDLKGKKLRAVNDKVVVMRAGRPKQTAGGLYLPDETQLVYNEGVVQSVGPDVKSCKAGETIVWAVFKGQAAGHHDEQRWIIADSEVLSVVEDEVAELPASAEVEAWTACEEPGCRRAALPLRALCRDHDVRLATPRVKVNNAGVAR